jgi:hypothetical protein
LTEEMKDKEQDIAAKQEGNGLQRKTEGVSPRFLIAVAAISITVIAVGFYLIKRHMEKSLEDVSPDFRFAHAVSPMPQRRSVSQQELKLFFTSNGKFLTPYGVDLPGKMNSVQRAHFIIRKLLEGSPAGYLESPIPQGTKLEGLYMVGNVAVVDLSSELREHLAGGLSSEQLCVYSIVNTIILNNEDIKAVQILIDGEKVDTIRGGVDIGSPLVEDVSLIRW